MAKRRITLFVPDATGRNELISDHGDEAQRRAEMDAEREQARRRRCYKTAWDRVSRFEKAKGLNRLGKPYGIKLVFSLILAHKANKAYSISAISLVRKISMEAARKFYERRLVDLEMMFGLESWARWEYLHGSKASEIERERWRHYAP